MLRTFASDLAGSPVLETDSKSLTDLREKFVLHWGEMANSWGINRTMGQIHALLYIAAHPLTADAITQELRISRGNASMSLRALEEWGVIRRTHITGDRRDYYQSVEDVWELARIVTRERKRREFDPMLRALQLFQAEAEGSGSSDDPDWITYRQRLGALLEVLEAVQTASERWLPGDPRQLPRLLEVPVEGLDSHGGSTA